MMNFNYYMWILISPQSRIVKIKNKIPRKNFFVEKLTIFGKNSVMFVFVYCVIKRQKQFPILEVTFGPIESGMDAKVAS